MLLALSLVESSGVWLVRVVLLCGACVRLRGSAPRRVLPAPVVPMLAELLLGVRVQLHLAAPRNMAIVHATDDVDAIKGLFVELEAARVLTPRCGVTIPPSSPLLALCVVARASRKLVRHGSASGRCDSHGSSLALAWVAAAA